MCTPTWSSRCENTAPRPSRLPHHSGSSCLDICRMPATLWSEVPFRGRRVRVLDLGFRWPAQKQQSLGELPRESGRPGLLERRMARVRRSCRKSRTGQPSCVRGSLAFVGRPVHLVPGPARRRVVRRRHAAVGRHGSPKGVVGGRHGCRRSRAGKRAVGHPARATGMSGVGAGRVCLHPRTWSGDSVLRPERVSIFSESAALHSTASAWVVSGIKR